MRIRPVQITDTLVLLALAALAWGVAGWLLAAPVLGVGVLLIVRSREPAADSQAELLEGRRRTYAQFEKDLNDPTGTSAISIFRDPH